MPGLSDPRGLWPLSSLPSPSPPWSQAPVEVRPAALPAGESGWRGRRWWAGGRAHCTVKAAAASSQPGLAHLMSSFLLRPMLTSSAPPAPVCQHLAHRLRRHHQRCQRRPPLAVAPPAVSAPAHPLPACPTCMLSAHLGGSRWSCVYLVPPSLNCPSGFLSG